MKETSSSHTTHLAVLCFPALLLCVTAVAYARGPESTYPVQVDSGWNLLSLPASVSNGSRAILFPFAASAAFVFRYPAGYEEQDTLRKGIGFWLKFNSPETVSITGELIFKDTIEVHAGWNIIGSLSVPMVVDSIKTEPSGIIASQFFRFRPGVGYEEADTLYPGYGYWVKANQEGSVVLSSSGGWPCPGIPTVLYAGKIYTSVQIGNQCWLRENLDVGTMIVGTSNQSDNSIIEKYCYNNDTSNCSTYGGLYQWQEAMKYRNTTQRVRGICPPGWHIPTLAELYTLSAAVDGDGNALKATGQGTGPGAGTNTSGFSALLAGYRESSGSFSDLGSNVVIWSSMQCDTSTTFGFVLSSLNAAVVLGDADQHYGFSVRCLEGDAPNLPPNTPSNPAPPDGSTRQSRSLTLSWSCSDPDGDSLTYDVYFGTTNPPVIVVSAGQSGTTHARSGLSVSTRYYWRAVAKDNHGDSTSGPVWSFTTTNMGYPCPGVPTVEYAGKTYNTVEIGSQCWLRENLDVGTMINGSGNQANNGIIEKYCYGNDTANCNTYGGLYVWQEAVQYDSTQGVQGICPAGWHVPTLAEFQALSATVGGDGNALKAIGQGSGTGAGTNTSGFSALLSGERLWNGSFHKLGQWTELWTSTEFVSSMSYLLALRDTVAAVLFGSAGRDDAGLSVRCLADEAPNPPPNPPSSPRPYSGATDVPLSTRLSWTCSDPDEDPLTYDVYFGTTNPPDARVCSNSADTTLWRSGLTGGTWYYWRVVARDNRDSAVGPVWSFRTAPMGFPCPRIPTVTYAGKVYSTAQIGDQCWLRENLDVGAMMPGSQDQTDDGAIEKYCYNNDPASCEANGGLYQWHEAMQYDTAQGGQGICPPGWHMPTLAEFQTLGAIVGGDGNALKAIGQGTGGGAGTNTSGHSALLAGRRSTNGRFDSFGSFAYFWSSTRYDAANAHDLFLHSGSAYVLLQAQSVSYGFSVRCLKNTSNLPPDAPSNPTPPDGSDQQSPSVMLGWSCSDPDGDALTFDVYFGTMNPPDTMVSSNQSGTTFGTSGLSGGTTYYWKVVASDAHTDKTSSPVWSFTTGTIGGSPCPGTPTVSYAGKIYNTVLIGARCWLRENLDVGTMVLIDSNQTNNGTIEKYCLYNDPAYCHAYGGLYQWDEAMLYDTVQNVQGICPDGWYVPTLGEFQTLGLNLSGDATALKAIGQGIEGGSGTNTSGFSALLAGLRNYDGGFYGLGTWGFFWTSTQHDASNAHSLSLYSTMEEIIWNTSGKTHGFSVRCIKEAPSLPPHTPSNPSPANTDTSVSLSPVLRWSCSDPDGDVLSYDVYFGFSNPPDTIVSFNELDTTIGRRGLILGTNYYWKVVARDNRGGETSGPVWSFTTLNAGSPCPGSPTVSYAGKIYNTVQIGSQCWLKENLDVGTMVLGDSNQVNNSIIEKYCYNDSTVNCNTYGGLYQWNEAMQYETTEGARGICPPGWHLPMLAEFQTLSATVGGDGNALKAIGQGIGAGAGTNTSGFSALLAGSRYVNGYFVSLGGSGYFWSSTQYDAVGAHFLGLYYNYPSISLYNYYKTLGFSVRCLED